MIGCLDSVGLSLGPSWPIDFGHVSETNGWEYGPKMMTLTQITDRGKAF